MDRKATINTIIQAALAAVEPRTAVHRHLRRDDDTLWVADRAYRLDDYERILVVGGGKAGAPMAAAVAEILGDCITAGLVNVKYGYAAAVQLPASSHRGSSELSSTKDRDRETSGETPPTPPGLRRKLSASVIQIVEAGHPVPDEAGRQGAERIAEMLSELTERDLVLCLISGGGSALLPLPVPGVSLADMQALTETLLRCGATINEINCVRKHVSRLKGGQLARLAYPATLIALILSDVVGNPLDVIASGPTVPDPTTFADAWAVLERYDIVDQVPPSITAHIKRGLAGEIPDTPKPGDPIFQRVQNVIVGDNLQAAQAAVEKARELGFNTLLLSTYIEGEAREVGRVFAGLGKGMARHGHPIAPPGCLVAGGETTVTVRGSGKGGRNQELALAAGLALEGWENVVIVALATDGTDGPTDAAGAIADGTTVPRARARGLDPAAYLRNNDAYHFFQALGDLIITGPTNTNVNDLLFVFVF